MTIASGAFFVIFPLIVLVYYFIPMRFRYAWIALVSLCLYLTNGWKTIWGLILCSLVSYICGIWIEKKRSWLPVCIDVVVLVFILAYIRAGIVSSVLVPIGISFYALQSMSYCIDVYRGDVKVEYNFVRLFAFVSFFPAVLSGPIQKAKSLLPVMKKGTVFEYNLGRIGFYRLLYGFFLKIVLAGSIGTMVDQAFCNYLSLTGAALAWGVILYGLQLYFDFAGYSAIAIGVANILGFDLDENFKQPYLAVGIRDFWNRWHISLSSWLADYVYIPLGGNRKGRFRRIINLLVTFTVSGVWHGFGLNYLFWGLLHGMYQIIVSLLPKWSFVNKSKHKIIAIRVGLSLWTFIVADFAWLFFRADSIGKAFAILRRIVTKFCLKDTLFYGTYLFGKTKIEVFVILFFAICILVLDIFHEKNVYFSELLRQPKFLVPRWMSYILITGIILLTWVRNYGVSASEFIYGKF